MTAEDFKRELQLTLENTESLYRQALAMKDTSCTGDEMVALYDATVAQIKENGGEVPTPFATDHEFVAMLDYLQSVACRLRREATA